MFDYFSIFRKFQNISPKYSRKIIKEGISKNLSKIVREILQILFNFQFFFWKIRGFGEI